MSSDYSVPDASSGWTSKRVYGIPIVYLAGGFVAILVIVAYLGSKKNTTGNAGTATATNAPVDPYATVTSTGTVSTGVPVYYVGSNTQNVDTGTIQTNSDWQKQAVEYLVSTGVSVGDAQGAIQAYLNGQDMTYTQGGYVNNVVAKYGVPPTINNIGTVAPPATTSTSTPSDPIAGSIQGFYQAYLHRAGSPQEMANWERVMAQNNLTLDQVRQDIQTSNEAKSKA